MGFNSRIQLPSPPLAHMNILRDIIITHGINLRVKRKSILPQKDNEGIPYCYFLTSGAASLIRKRPKITLGIVDSPVCIGLNRIFGNAQGYIQRAETELQLYYLDIVTMKKHIDERKLWCNVSYVLSYQVELLQLRDSLIFGKNSYDIIKILLHRLISQPETYRKKIGVAQFIQQRTTLSRSAIMKILHQLKLGGYIETNQGKLVSLKILPENY